MTCCVFVLALVYQLIDSWHRLRTFFGLPETSAGSSTFAPRPGPRRNRWVYALFAVVAVEGAIAGNLFYEHRHHLNFAGREMLFAASGLAADLCGDEKTLVAELPASVEE